MTDDEKELLELAIKTSDGRGSDDEHDRMSVLAGNLIAKRLPPEAWGEYCSLNGKHADAAVAFRKFRRSLPPQVRRVFDAKWNSENPNRFAVPDEGEP